MSDEKKDLNIDVLLEKKVTIKQLWSYRWIVIGIATMVLDHLRIENNSTIEKHDLKNAFETRMIVVEQKTNGYGDKLETFNGSINNLSNRIEYLDRKIDTKKDKQ